MWTLISTISLTQQHTYGLLFCVRKLVMLGGYAAAEPLDSVLVVHGRAVIGCHWHINCVPLLKGQIPQSKVEHIFWALRRQRKPVKT